VKLYYFPLSGSSRRVLLTVAHLDLPVDRVVVDLQKGEHRASPHRDRNPNARVPVLDDGGFVLWESRAIMQYLADRTPAQTVYPTDARGRADVNRWLFWCAAHMSVSNTILVQENLVKPLSGRGPADPAEVARGEALFAQHASVLDTHLANKTWIAQDRLTLADFSVAAAFALAGPAKIPVASFANIRAWLARVKELDAWKRTDPPGIPKVG
jgi:glutathione S-transferase